MQNAQISC